MTSPRALDPPSNDLPAMNRIFIIPKYSGRTEFIVVKPPRSGAEFSAVPSATHEPIITLVRVGTLSATVTCSTPGSRRAASSIRMANASRSDGFGYRDAGSSTGIA